MSVTQKTDPATNQNIGDAEAVYRDGSGNPVPVDATHGLPAVAQIADGVTPANKATVAQFHNADHQALPGTAYGLLGGGVAQLLDYSGNLDRQRETGTDGIAPTGIATGAAQFAMSFKTTDSTDNFAAGTRTFTPAAMSGTVSGVAWSIQVGSVLTLDTGGSAETVLVTAVTSTTFTGVTTKTHNGTVTAFPITGYVYNQERDAAGELDIASGSGAAVAVEMEYNGGHPTAAVNYERVRSLVGLGLGTSAITTATQGAASLVLASATGIQQGQPIILANNANLALATVVEEVYSATNYTPGATTIPLISNIVNSGLTNAFWPTYAALGPQQSGFLANGEGAEAVALFNPRTGQHYLERSNYGTIVRASATQTGTYTSADIENVNGHFLHVILDVTVTGGATLVLTINGKDPASGKYYPILTGASVTTVSTNVYRVGPALTAVANATVNDIAPEVFQIVVSGANGTTFSLGANINE